MRSGADSPLQQPALSCLFRQAGLIGPRTSSPIKAPQSRLDGAPANRAMMPVSISDKHVAAAGVDTGCCHEQLVNQHGGDAEGMMMVLHRMLRCCRRWRMANGEW